MENKSRGIQEWSGAAEGFGGNLKYLGDSEKQSSSVRLKCSCQSFKLSEKINKQINTHTHTWFWKKSLEIDATPLLASNLLKKTSTSLPGSWERVEVRSPIDEALLTMEGGGEYEGERGEAAWAWKQALLPSFGRRSMQLRSDDAACFSGRRGRLMHSTRVRWHGNNGSDRIGNILAPTSPSNLRRD